MLFSISVLTREAAMNIVNQHCRKELDKFGACVGKHPESWNTSCADARLELARCSENNPIIRQIKTSCAEPFQKYEVCISQNSTDVLQCKNSLKEFLLCAEQISPIRA
ncbi:coiled-coil-helix-coiled-coil-helix domain-containing protein 5-like isoform X1 [Tachypleus tridentatus]|uniref:coiled-coil-helix-coiled-coil-helix domain-containing protein 5-like isoform X1 n=2 Tax=Tachypleus tridentatus TaxID=6853 RepID=UPI003FD45D83